MSGSSPARPVLRQVFAVALGLLAACAEPVPVDKSDYVGLWVSETVALRIHASGRVAYERHDGDRNISIQGPIRSWSGADFSVGIGFLSTTFEVTRPPFREDGVWKMVVDGRTLQRVAGPEGERPEFVWLRRSGLLGPL